MREILIRVDENIKPSNIKKGVEILGVEGTLMQGYKTSISSNMLVFTNQDNADIQAIVEESELNL